MARHYWLFLTFSTLASTDFYVIRRDKADYFIWQNGPECWHIAHAEYANASSCKCDDGATYSTGSNSCEFFREQVYYRFDRRGIGGTSVSAVYADCGSQDSICTLNSTITKTELAITTVGNELLNSNSNCVINSVEIMHDCMPRCVDLNFTFSSHSDKVYLKLHRPASLNYLEGELFLLDVTCVADGAINKKMMFKFNGTRRLDKPGSFCNVPAYDPSKSCSDITTPTCTSSASGCTVSPTSTVKVTTTIFTSSVSANTAHVTPTSTAKPNHTDSSTTDIEIGVTLGAIVILVLILITIFVIYRRFKDRCQNWCARPHGDGV